MKPSEEPIEVPESVHRGVVVADQVTGNVIVQFFLLLFVVAEKDLVIDFCAVESPDFGTIEDAVSHVPFLFSNQRSSKSYSTDYLTRPYLFPPPQNEIEK